MAHGTRVECEVMLFMHMIHKTHIQVDVNIQICINLEVKDIKPLSLTMS